MLFTRPTKPTTTDAAPPSWRRDLGAVLLAVGLHGLPVVLGLIPALALRLLPKPPIEFELLPPRPRPATAATAAVDPAAELPAPPSPAAAPPRPPLPAKQPGSKPAPPGPRPSPDVQKYGLGKARLSGLGPAAIDQDIGARVLLRMATLRQSPHRTAAEALLNAFPDNHILAAGSPLARPGAMAKALIDDVDSLLIATADPRDISATVFYAVPRAGSSLGSQLASRRSPRWDRRTLYTLQPTLLAFARPDLLAPPASQPGAATDRPATEPTERPANDRLLQALRQPGPAVYAEVHNLHQRLRLRGGLPTPTALRLALSADADPDLHARIELSSPADAALLVAALPGLKQELASRLFWFGLSGLLGGIAFEQRGAAVELHGRLPRNETALLLAVVCGLMPPPDRFLDPPPPPAAEPAAPAAPPDLGPAPRPADGG